MLRRRSSSGRQFNPDCLKQLTNNTQRHTHTHTHTHPEKKKEQHYKVESLLHEFGLKAIRKRRGDLLSGGERRRTEIARALATSPSFILLDEPFAGVDPLAVEDIQKIVRDLTKRNIGILITDHNVQETLAITDRTYLMFEGSILTIGEDKEI